MDTLPSPGDVALRCSLFCLMLLLFSVQANAQWTVDRLEGDFYLITGEVGPLDAMINWSAATGPVAGYKVEVSTLDDNIVLGWLTTTGKNNTSGLIPCGDERIRIFRVLAFDLDGNEGPFSEFGPPIKCVIARRTWNPKGVMSESEGVMLPDFSLFAKSFRGHFAGSKNAD